VERLARETRLCRSRSWLLLWADRRPLGDRSFCATWTRQEKPPPTWAEPGEQSGGPRPKGTLLSLAEMPRREMASGHCKLAGESALARLLAWRSVHAANNLSVVERIVIRPLAGDITGYNFRRRLGVNGTSPLCPWREAVGPAAHLAGPSVPKQHIVPCRVKLTIRHLVIDVVSHAQLGFNHPARRTAQLTDELPRLNEDAVQCLAAMLAAAHRIVFVRIWPSCPQIPTILQGKGPEAQSASR